ncbi:MAG: non-homologous end-joining DNA ligase [Candidatus Limnocylindria bacterium]
MSAFRPMLATLSRDVVVRPGWVFEEKYDGIRALAHRRGKSVRLVSRNDLDLTTGFPHVVAAVAALPGGDLVLDGELVVFDSDGVSRFQLLQRRGADATPRSVYAVFDVLERDGKRLTALPLRDRRAALESLVAGARPALRVSRRVRGDGAAAYARAAQRGWEGIIAKDESSPYEPVRSKSWLKVKVRHESEFVIGGHTPPAGSRTVLGALLVGLFDGDALRYTGKVGTGYTVKTLDDLGRRLAPIRTDRAPFDPVPRVRDARWVRPDLVAQLAFAEWTADGRLRQPVFLGLRMDKSPRECVWSEREP